MGCLYDDYKYKPLHTVVPKMSAFVKSFDSQIKWMLLVEGDGSLEKCNAFWDKVSSDIKKDFDSKPIYDKKFWKPK